VFARLYGIGDARIDETLALVGLTDKAHARTDHLSGGQAQRLSIACAIAHRPEVFFLDEPTSGLDPQARHNLWDVIRAVADGGSTVVLTTHFLDEAESLCDRVAIMDHGRILALDTPAAMIRDLDAPVRIAVRAGRLSAEQARAMPGVTSVRDDETELVIETRQADRVLLAIAERGALEGLRVSGATLEDVFLSLTGREYRE
jgi:ABC-2 type transport system ATP-binding protein